MSGAHVEAAGAQGVRHGAGARVAAPNYGDDHRMCTTVSVCTDSIAAANTFWAARPSVPGAVDLVRGRALVELLDKPRQAIAKGVVEVAHAAEHRVGVDAFLRVARRIEGGLAEDVVDDEPALGASHFSALHGMAPLDVVAAGQVPKRAAFEAHVELGCGPDGAPGGFKAEALDGFDVAAEVAHDVHRVRM